MPRFFGRRRRAWPELTHAEIVKRSRIIVIDDAEFPYLPLFKEDGYSIEKWDDVNDLPRLEKGDFDLILLDLHGVGAGLSSDQGLGILSHLRKVNPAVVVVAYSNAEWSLEYQPFFEQADAALHKTKADYVEFKRTVDTLLDRRFSKGFFLDRIANAVPAELSAEIAEKAEAAILKGDLEGLRRHLTRRVDDQAAVDRVIALAQVAVGVIQIWKN